jgi:hypothetical protein
MEVLEAIIKFIVQMIWKVFILTIWGFSKLAEIIFQQINNFLKEIIK